MKTSSAKSKGRRFQQEIRDLILENFKQLEPDDVRSTGMGQPGEDLLLSPAARKVFPFASECKNQETTSIWQWIKQAEENSNGHKPLVLFKRNRSKSYAVIEVNDLMDILKELYELKNK